MDIGRQLKVIVVEPEEIELAPAKNESAPLVEDLHHQGDRMPTPPASAPPRPPAPASTRRR